MKKVLVVPSGTEIGQEVVRSLNYLKDVELYGANSITSYSEIKKQNTFIGLPYVNQSGFIEAVKDIVDKHGITHVFPAHDSASILLSEFQSEINAKVISSSFETNKICRSKRLTYSALSEFVNVPKTYSLNDIDKLTYPLFAKPDIGQGSVGAKKINSVADLSALSEDDVLCEYLPGDEYTVDCVTDSHGNLLYAHARKRISMRNGIAIETELVSENKPFFEFAKKVNAVLNLEGAWFIQVKEREDGELCLLEAATRVAGSMFTNRLNGVNFAELALLIADGVSVKALPNDLRVKLYRSLSYQFDTDLDFNTIYTDFDDCLIFGDTVNHELVSFIYKAINQGVKVVLITRHAGDLSKKLKDLRLSNLFDQIIHITDKSPKSLYMTEKKAIFIDDAFSERLDVRNTLSIPCFSVDMVAGLLTMEIKKVTN